MVLDVGDIIYCINIKGTVSLKRNEKYKIISIDNEKIRVVDGVGKNVTTKK